MKRKYRAALDAHALQIESIRSTQDQILEELRMLTAIANRSLAHLGGAGKEATTEGGEGAAAGGGHTQSAQSAEVAMAQAQAHAGGKFKAEENGVAGVEGGAETAERRQTRNG